MPVRAVLFADDPEQLEGEEGTEPSQFLEHHHLEAGGRRLELVTLKLQLLELPDQRLKLGGILGEPRDDLADLRDQRAASAHLGKQNLPVVPHRGGVDMLKGGGVLFHPVDVHPPLWAKALLPT